jgi:tetratricopeptide (TPR) repeat protein
MMFNHVRPRPVALLGLVLLQASGASKNLIVNETRGRMLVYEIPDPEGREESVRYLEHVRDGLYPGAEIVDATSLDDATLREKLKGTVTLYTILSEKSRLLRLVARSLPLQIQNGTFRWDDFTSPAADLRIVFVGRHPYGEGYSLVYAAGTNALLAQANNMFHGPSSYHIYGGPGRGELLREGVYDQKFAEQYTRRVNIDSAAERVLIDFLSKNKEVLNVAAGGTFDASLIDTKGKEIFLLGEVHGIALNNDLDFALLDYLHKNAGVRVYLAEMSYAGGLLINKYLRTGDETLLDFMFRQLPGTVAWNKENRTFLGKLRQWNLSLPAGDRIRYIGIDLEHQSLTTLRGLNELVSESTAAGRAIPSGLCYILSRVSRILASAVGSAAVTQSSIGQSTLHALSNDLSDSLQEHHAEYASLLGDRLFDFELIATNWRKSYAHRALMAAGDHGFSNRLRDRAMYDTFLKVHAKIPATKYYGRWGNAHVAQRPYEGLPWLASQFSSPGSPVAGQIVSIWPVHQNTLALTAPAYVAQPVSGDDPALVRILSAATSSDLTLFKLAGADSPFEKGLYGFRADDQAVTSNVVQYFIFVRNGTPAHPIGAYQVPDGRTSQPWEPSTRRAGRRAQKDNDAFTSKELQEIRGLFEAAIKDWAKPEGTRKLQEIVNRFPHSNGAGCALVYLGQMATGEEQERYLNMAISDYSDCLCGDLVQAGAYARYLLGLRYAQTGRDREADRLFVELRNDYSEAVDHDGTLLNDSMSRLLGATFVAFGNTKVLAREYDEAIGQFQKALKFYDPNSMQVVRTHLRIGELYRRKGDFERAVTELRMAEQIAPDYETVTTTLGLTFEQMGRFEEAQKAYESAIRHDPADGVALNNLAYILTEHGGDLDQALVYARRARELLPELAAISDTLGWIFFKKSMFDDAVCAFREAVRQEPGNASFHYRLALAFSRTGDLGEARAALQTALGENPTPKLRQEIEELQKTLGP